MRWLLEMSILLAGVYGLWLVAAYWLDAVERPAHRGAEEHPVGSEADCPGCRAWQDRGTGPATRLDGGDV
jgi:hypothetical protein